MVRLRLTALILCFGLVSLSLMVSLNLGYATLISEEELKGIFLKEFKVRLGLKDDEVRLKTFRVEPRTYELKRNQPYRLDWITAPRPGSNTAILTYTGANGNSQSIRLWGFVEVLKKVPIVVKPLQAGEMLREDHVSLEFTELSRLPHDVVFDISSALGKEVRVSLRPGMVLRRSHLQLPLLVKRNEEVELIAQGKNFIVKAKGIALENGRLGEVIRVRNKESKKVVFAKVAGERLVEVSY